MSILKVCMPSLVSGGARCRQVRCGGDSSSLLLFLARRPNMVPSRLARRLQARGGGRSVSLRGGRGSGVADRERLLPLCPRSMCGQRAPIRPCRSSSHPQSVLAHLMHGLLSYITLKCGAIGPVLKHGPRSYTLSRVEGDDEPYTRSESKLSSRPCKYTTCEGTDCLSLFREGGALMHATRPSDSRLRPLETGRLSGRAYTREGVIYPRPG